MLAEIGWPRRLLEPRGDDGAMQPPLASKLTLRNEETVLGKAVLVEIFVLGGHDVFCGTQSTPIIGSRRPD